jgi:ribonuclease D
VTQIQNAINAKNFAEAERLLAEANRRFPGEAAWGQLKARLDAAKAAAGGDAQKLAQMRDLVAQARAAANAGDFIRANQLMAQANAILPNHPEIAQANAAIGAQRTAAGNALVTQIQNAINAKNFAEAERLLAEANRRFPGEAVWATMRQRIDQAKAANPPPPPLTNDQARALIVGLIAANLQRDDPQALTAYRAEPSTSKTLAYCILWPAVTRTAMPRGALGLGRDVPNNNPAVAEKAALDACRAARTPAMGACDCVVVDRNGANALVVPPAVLQRLNQ